MSCNTASLSQGADLRMKKKCTANAQNVNTIDIAKGKITPSTLIGMQVIHQNGSKEAILFLCNCSEAEESKTTRGSPIRKTKVGKSNNNEKKSQRDVQRNIISVRYSLRRVWVNSISITTEDGVKSAKIWIRNLFKHSLSYYRFFFPPFFYPHRKVHDIM